MTQTARSQRHPRRALLAAILGAALLAGFAVLPVAGRAADADDHGILDGKTFRTELGKKDSTKGELDEIVFSRGLFRSATGEEHGFRDAPYRTTQSGSTIRFAVSSESYEEGAMAWEGLVLGDHVEGKLSWTENHHPVEYWFRGKLKR